jgi:hypothetical protein
MSEVQKCVHCLAENPPATEACQLARKDRWGLLRRVAHELVRFETETQTWLPPAEPAPAKGAKR